MAGRPCDICYHPQRREIEQALALGGSEAGVAKAYGVKRDCVRRHHVGSHALRPDMPPRPVPKPKSSTNTCYKAAIKIGAGRSPRPRFTKAAMREHSKAMASLVPEAPDLGAGQEAPTVPEPSYFQIKPVTALIQAGQHDPAAIPNAYQMLEQLSSMLYQVIDAPEPKGKDGGPAAEWTLIADRQYKLGAMRELRATIAATLKLWEAQRAIEERYSGNKPLKASEIVGYLRVNYPEALLGLLEHLRSQRMDSSID
jgi:hypothetical protein